MKQNFKKNFISAIVFVLLLSTYIYIDTQKDKLKENTFPTQTVFKDGIYTSKEDVSKYILEFEQLPSNYITKKEATALGWKASEGNLWDVSDQKSIGGDRFGNRERILPKGNYFEADIDYEGGYRNELRLVYTLDGEIYYTDDHYASFEQLYGAEMDE